MHRTVSCLLIAGFLGVFVAGRSSAQAPALASLYAAYMAGDVAAVARTLPDEAAFRAIRGELFQAARADASTWTPSMAGFLLEVVRVGYARQWLDTTLLLQATRDMVMKRPQPVGRDAAEDAFEITFHRAAVGLLSGQRTFDRAEAYLTAIASRVSATPGTAGRLVDPRLPLARALLEDMRTAPAEGLGLEDLRLLPTQSIDARNGAAHFRADRAIALYVDAARDASVAAEADVRRAWLLHRLGRTTEGLARLNAPAPGDEAPEITYWRRLFLGRMLESLNRLDEAATAYEEAERAWPQAQTPAVALAALYQRTDRPADAQRWAAIARSTPDTVIDPWWQYWSGDYRMLPVWLGQLRRSRP
jgi:hypothetical protein